MSNKIVRFIEHYEELVEGKYMCWLNNGEQCVLFGRPVRDHRGLMVPDKQSFIIFSLKKVLPNLTREKLAFYLMHENERQRFVREYGHYIVLPSGKLFNIDDFVDEICESNRVDD